MKYYRVIDGKISDEPFEFGGSTVFCMADKTTDGRSQHLLAVQTIEDVKAVAKIDDTSALTALKITDEREVKPILEPKEVIK